VAGSGPRPIAGFDANAVKPSAMFDPIVQETTGISGPARGEDNTPCSVPPVVRKNSRAQRQFVRLARSHPPSMVSTIYGVIADLLHPRLILRSHAQLAAENLVLGKQLALDVERQMKPRRASKVEERNFEAPPVFDPGIEVLQTAPGRLPC
jgi:hypothetical protein